MILRFGQKHYNYKFPFSIRKMSPLRITKEFIVLLSLIRNLDNSLIKGEKFCCCGIFLQFV